MYKTVRQGENSLQYTILPQSEEVFTNSGLKGKGRDYSPSNQPSRRIHRKVNVIHFTFLFFSSLLTMAVALVILNHFGVAPGLLRSTIAERIRAFKELNETIARFDQQRSISAASTSSSSSSSSSSTTTVSSIVTNFKTTESESNLSAQSTVKPKDEIQAEFIQTTVPPRRESNNDLMLGHGQINWTDYQDEDDDDDDYDINKSITNPSDPKKSYMTKTSSKIIIPTVVSVFKSRFNTSPTSSIKVIKNNEASNEKEKNKTLKESILDDNDEDFKEFNNDPIEEVAEPRKDDIKMSQTKSSWLQNKWPFVDPSSYFQWTDYNARDNLLLPAILSAVLSALFVLAILCYAMRRRQRCKKRIQEIGNLTSDLQAGDNANLLTAENPSEEE